MKRFSAGMFVLVALLVTATTLWTRGPAPWVLQVTNDEMLHLESFRNHYRTNDIYPELLEKVGRAQFLSEAQRDLVTRAYNLGPIVQRGMIVLTDLHPPFFPVMLETIESLTTSNLTVTRLVSMIGSIIGVFLMYRLGCTLVDRTLGLWLAALLAVNYVSICYAGIARPYAVTQAALIGAVWMFARERQSPHATPARLLLACLIAQSLNWVVWAAVVPLVLIDLACRWRAGSTLRTVLRQTWWYGAACLLFVGYMGLQMVNPVTSRLTGSRSMMDHWNLFIVSSPFAEIDWVSNVYLETFFSPAIIVMLLLVAVGLAVLLADPDFIRSKKGGAAAEPAVRLGLIVVYATVTVAGIALASGVRMTTLYVIAPMVLIGIGLQWILRTPIASYVGIIALLALTGVSRHVRPDDRYARIFWQESEYQSIAERLAEQLDEGDIWFAIPRHRADCLYRYAELPPPHDTGTTAELEELLRSATGRRDDTLVLLRTWDLGASRSFGNAAARWDFPNNFTLIEFNGRRRRRR